jgi:murein DD-endopeptidase MepM/ murein hydrolase activator NlpD
MAEYCYPCLPAVRFTVQPGTEFLSRGYEIATGALHTGCDVNITSGGDSDLGYPVRAITDGIVVHAGWDGYVGGIVIIYHPGPRVWSTYWHLQPGSINVVVGAKVQCGDKIGKIGKGGHKQFLAHLHLEIRTAPPSLKALKLAKLDPKNYPLILPANAWPTAMYQRRNIWGRVVSYDRTAALAFVEAHYVDPIPFLVKNNAVKTLLEVT